MALQKIFTFFIASVWLVNGLFYKVLGLMPRHKQIVAKILGETYATELTFAIGIGEIFISFWFLTGIYRRENVIFQIILVVTMNCIEFFLSPDLLMFGRGNIILASGFVVFLYYFEFLPKHQEIGK